MQIAVIDGQGGGIGKHIVEKIRRAFADKVTIIALGTNSVATSQMLKAGANEGATGENAICHTVRKMDIIIGSVAILAANSMLGELTPRMAQAIGEAEAVKVLLPINRSRIQIVGAADEPLPHQIDEVIEYLKKLLEEE
ncbi:MAG: DUF3842 family protein [Thermoanaerobacteraceae bacterium]|nr:DUF3842 family protein [Thermoanaerobacteraceae bacterium]